MMNDTASVEVVHVSPLGSVMVQRGTICAGKRGKSKLCRFMWLEESHLQADDEVCSASREFGDVTAAPEVSLVSLDGHASSQGRTLPVISLQPCKAFFV